MKIVILPDYDAVSEYACARLIAKMGETVRRPFVLGLPTGGTPVGMYRKIAEKHIDFSNIITFNMDEYIGLSKDNVNSFYHFMDENLYSKVNLDPSHINIPDGTAADIERECAEYEKKITAAGGIDLFFGGVGSNGHIAFNEPGSSFSSRTRVIELTEKTIRDNSRFFADPSEVPKKAISVGIATILSARELVFLATGENKARAVKTAVEGEISEKCPVTALRKHGNATLVVDGKAAALLNR